MFYAEISKPTQNLLFNFILFFLIIIYVYNLSKNIQKEIILNRIIKIILSDILIFFVLLLSFEFGVYKYYIFKYNRDRGFSMLPFKIRFVIPYNGYYEDMINFFNRSFFLHNYTGRPPAGVEYKDKTPVILFGCSYAYGEKLKDSQTFGSKLSGIIKRPVINRAMPGTGLQHMYMQVKSDWFYETVPYSDTFIYVFFDDHYRRMKVNYFNVLYYDEYPVFKVKNGKLVLVSQNNKVLNFIRGLYISKYLNHVLTYRYINNPKNAQALTDEVLLYFTETRKELQKHYGNNIKFYVILYSVVPYSDILRKKLEENGFITISTLELTDKNLYSPEFVIPNDGHPAETVWDLLTPLIVDKLNLKNEQ